MHINMTRPEWDQFRESYVYRVGKGPCILGRVDFISSLGYWWQTADYTGVCYNLRDAKREVEGALQPAGELPHLRPGPTPREQRKTLSR